MNDPRVTLISWVNDPLETLYVIWWASKTENPLLTVDQVKAGRRDPADSMGEDGVLELFRKVVAQKIPVSESIYFNFVMENVSVSWREQAVRHRVGHKHDDRIGVDIVPNLVDSSFWSQCLAPDTQIKLLDGTSPTIKELTDKGGDFWVYSCDKFGNVVPGHGHSARRTKQVKCLVEVILDNGEIVKCTTNHLWLGRDGKYVEAKDLCAGYSLMPLYTCVDNHGYEMLYNPADGQQLHTHRMVDAYINGDSVPKGITIHHVSFNKRNNDPGQLDRMCKADHILLHADNVLEMMANDPEGHSARLSAGQKAKWVKMNNEEKAARLSQLAKARESIDSVKRNQVAKLIMDERWSDPAWREKMEPILAKQGGWNKGKKHNAQTRKKMSKSAKVRALRDSKRLAQNHKVISVKILTEASDVYDISVDGHHNFALGADVFVHNSMRIMDMGGFASAARYREADTIAKLRETHPGLWRGYHSVMRAIENTYNELVAAGVPMEDARDLIPLGAHHRISWTMNINSMLHIVGKRSCWILQLGLWGPVIRGMIRECGVKIHPVFFEMASPPCMEGDDYSGCHFVHENERRITGEDEMPLCPLYLKNQHDGEAPQHVDSPEWKRRCDDYADFWGRNPWTGVRVAK